MSTSSQNLITSLGPIANLLVQSGPQLIQNRPLRKVIVKNLKKSIISDLRIKHQQADSIPGVDEDKAAFGLAIVDTLDRALENRYFSDKVIHTLLNIVGRDLFLK